MKIVFTGPESSGKTTISRQIATFFNIPLVEEYAREYLENKRTQKYSYDELLKIHLHQEVLHEKALEINPVIICDTDALTIAIWSNEVFGKVDRMIQQTVEIDPPEHYFICKPDIPWMKDPLRENPNDRDRLFEQYLHRIQNLFVPYTIVAGDEESRLTICKTVMSQLLNNL